LRAECLTATGLGSRVSLPVAGPLTIAPKEC
jgi:hypothetical protein